MALYGAFDLVTGSGKIVNEYWEEELDDHQNQYNIHQFAKE